MALVLKDRIKETTSTTGTGTYTLAGAETGFEAFSQIGNTNTTYYCCTDGVDFEVGIGTYTLSGTTLARTTILQSSNSDAAVSWANGRRTIFCTQPAEKAVFLDANGNLPITSSSSVGGSLAVTGDGTVGGTLGVTGATTLGGLVTANAKIDLNGTELILDADADTSITADTDDQIDIKIAGTDQLTIKDGAISPVTDSDIDLGTTSLRYKDAFIDTVTTTGNVVVGGDLTITGDDLTMGTNTAGHLLVADGTNFNPTAVGDLSSISTVANDDVFLAVDTSGGGLKQITRSTIVSGLAIGGVALSNVVEDTTPQLGGNLDMNGKDIVTTSNADLELAPNGTGHVTVRGNTNQGTIQFNCESNSHGQKIKAAPHSESADNVLTLPSTGGDARLVSATSTATLTNKTLTSPKINEDVAVTSTATELNVLDGITAVVGELNALDIGSTAIGTAVASKAVILDANKDYTGIRNLTATGDVVVGGDLTINGDTVTASVTNMVVADNLIELNNGATSNSNDSGIVIERGSTGDNAIFMWDESADTFVLGTTTATGASTGNLSVTDGALQAGSLDISGNIDVDGTANLDVVDIDGAVNMATTATITGNLTLGAQLIMPDVTSTKILVADGTSFQEVAISGDVTIANTGAVTIAANAVEGSMLNDNTISGQTALTSGLASDDELLVSDGGTLKRMDVSVLTTVTDDSATALAIALG